VASALAAELKAVSQRKNQYMDDNIKYSPPDDNTKDTAHLVTSGLLSFIPGAPELFEYFVQPSLEKRLVGWRNDVADALNRLEENQRIQIASLQSSELFVTMLMQATRLAVRNHQQEKLNMLRNAILNTASGIDLNEDLHLLFIRYIDELIPAHFFLLKFFYDNESELAFSRSYEKLYSIFDKKNPKLLSKDEFKLLCGDLVNRGLLRISQDIDDFDDMYVASALLNESTRDDLPFIKGTELGRDLQKFVAEYDDISG